jgi:hypothetical protein
MYAAAFSDTETLYLIGAVYTGLNNSMETGILGIPEDE